MLSQDLTTTEPAPDERLDVVERIRHEAMRLFVARGFDATTMRDVASAVGISPGNLTYHFKRKIDLFRGAIEARYAAFLDELRAIAATPGIDARDRLRLLLDRFAALTQGERDLLKVVLRELITNPTQLDEFGPMLRYGHPVILLGAIDAAVREGQLPPGVGIGLLPIIMGTLVLAPVVFSAIAVAEFDSDFTAAVFGRAHHDLYILLGFDK